jgi:hypothetical protein
MSVCNRCGKNIYWARGVEGKNVPHNEDGVVHFRTCKPDPEKMKRFAGKQQKRRAKDDNPLQIGEDDFI